MVRSNSRRGRETVRTPRTGRVWVVGGLILLMMSAVLARAWQLQVRRNAHYAPRNEHRIAIEVDARRGDILDRKGRTLAGTADAPSIYAVPRLIEQPFRTAQELGSVLELPGAQLSRRLLLGNQNFRWIKRHVGPEERAAVEAAGLPGIGVRREPRRFYPKRTLAGQLLGYVDIDGRGRSGIERSLDDQLRGQAYRLEALVDARQRTLLTDGYLPPEMISGYSVHLTIDARIQEVTEAALAQRVAAADARGGGVAVVLDPRTGDILALAQNPSFDPNYYREAASEHRKLRAVSDIFEPGSTVKALNVAAALDLGLVNLDTTLPLHKGAMRIAGGHLVKDTFRMRYHRDKKTRISVAEVLKLSSNIGALQLAQMMGAERYHRYLRAFGLGEPTGLPLVGEQRGVLHPAERWGPAQLATIGYGYGLQATPMQLARAVATLANGGVMMAPRLIRDVRDARGEVVARTPARVQRRVVSEKVARLVAQGMVGVTDDDGTAPKARVDGYTVAGKTGTARKVDPRTGRYVDEYATWFVGFVPAERPALAMCILIDDPRADGVQGGGTAASPAFARIAAEVLPYLGVQPTRTLDGSGEVADGGSDAAREPIEARARPWWFEEPVVEGAPGHVVVPDLRGRPLREVALEAAELQVKLEVEGSGLVVAQRPEPGALMPRAEPLTVVLALPGALAAADSEDRPEEVVR